MKNWLSISLLALLVAATSCASRKKTVAPTHPQTFEWMTSNISIKAEGNGQSFDDLSGQIRMRNDSLIWISIDAAFGVEVLRAKVSNDSIWVINRLEKTYLVEPLDTLSTQLGMPLSLPLLQTLLFDNNKGLPPVENQEVLLKTFVMGNMSAKIKYNKVRLNEETTFPMKITNKMKRFRIK